MIICGIICGIMIMILYDDNEYNGIQRKRERDLKAESAHKQQYQAWGCCFACSIKNSVLVIIESKEFCTEWFADKMSENSEVLGNKMLLSTIGSTSSLLLNIF